MADKINPFDPTEKLTQNVARKRKLAELLMSLGLKQQNYVNPMQVIGQMAQTWAGNQMDKSADNDYSALIDAIRANASEDMATAQSGTASKEAVAAALARSGGYMPDIVTKPLEAAASEQATWNARPRPQVHGNIVYDQRTMKPGQVVAGDPNNLVMRNPDGSLGLNKTAFSANLYQNAARGGTLDETSMQMGPDGIPTVSVPNSPDPFQPPQYDPNQIQPMPPPDEEEFLKQNIDDPRIKAIARQKYPKWYSMNVGEQ